MANPTDPVTTFAADVLSGKIVAGRLAHLACARHLRDLEHGADRGLSWDADAAQRALDFFSFLTLPGGQQEDRPFTLSPFQQFIVGSLFGWKSADGSRRFRTAYIEAGKGSGKTPMLGAIGLYGLVADGEQAAEVYSAATTREQANILFRDARLMAERSAGLSKRLDISAYNIAHLPSASFFRAVSSEHRGLDGKRVHFGLLDEIHEHPTGMVVDKIRAGTKGRRQALIVEITNSGHDRTTVCWQHHEYSIRVLKAEHPDDPGFNDSWFAYVCQLDPCEKHWQEGATQPVDGCEDCDDWKDESTWLKANPNLGVSVTLKYLREQVQEAIGMPTKEGIVKRLCFCIWTESTTRAIPMDKWDLCAAGIADPARWRAEQLERLAGRDCYGGLDLGSTSDLTALALVFPDGDGYTVLPWFWVPRQSARRREERDRVPYLTWARQGFITLTEGDVTDYDQVRADLSDIGGKFRIVELAVDRLFQGAQLCTQLADDGFDLIAFGQGFLSMAAPTKRFLELVIGGELLHGGNPVLRWMASNCAAETDAAGNIKFSKKASTEKIDGCVGGVMAIGRLMERGDFTGSSVYDAGESLAL